MIPGNELGEELTATTPQPVPEEAPGKTYFVKVEIGAPVHGCTDEASALEYFKERFIRALPGGSFMDSEFYKFEVASESYLD